LNVKPPLHQRKAPRINVKPHDFLATVLPSTSVVLKLPWFVANCQRLSTLVAPCSSIGFCNITGELFSKGPPARGPRIIALWPPGDRGTRLRNAVLPDIREVGATLQSRIKGRGTGALFTGGLLCSAGLTIVANVAIATGPALLGAPRSSVIDLIYYIIYENLFSLRSQEVIILLNLP